MPLLDVASCPSSSEEPASERDREPGVLSVRCRLTSDFILHSGQLFVPVREPGINSLLAVVSCPLAFTASTAICNTCALCFALLEYFS